MDEIVTADAAHVVRFARDCEDRDIEGVCELGGEDSSAFFLTGNYNDYIADKRQRGIAVNKVTGSRFRFVIKLGEQSASGGLCQFFCYVSMGVGVDFVETGWQDCNGRDVVGKRLLVCLDINAHGKAGDDDGATSSSVTVVTLFDFGDDLRHMRFCLKVNVAGADDGDADRLFVSESGHVAAETEIIDVGHCEMKVRNEAGAFAEKVVPEEGIAFGNIV